MALQERSRRKLKLWLFKGIKDHAAGTRQHPWWQVMCLTGVDYFSTLGYQPGIAFVAAGVLSPIATLVLVLLTLFGALPMYHRVAAESPHGDGSISMLEDLLARWKGKLFVRALLGFAATSFIITITLSAADATAHIVENPFVHTHLPFLHHRILVTLILLTALGAIFLKGLLNIVPRYLPKYGMAPEWARATRPLVVVFTVICFVVTILFRADVDAQGGAYATGVLALMTSAAIAVTLSTWRRGETMKWAFMLISLVFAYTTVVNMIEQPEGIKIALVFIIAIVFSSLVSRVWRTTELRVERVELDDLARDFIRQAASGTIRIITNRCDRGDAVEYKAKEDEKRTDNHIPSGEPILFFEVTPGDASEFSGVLRIRGEKVGAFRVLRTESPAVPNAIAAFLLYLRNETGKLPHVYFGWSEGNPLSYLF